MDIELTEILGRLEKRIVKSDAQVQAWEDSLTTIREETRKIDDALERATRHEQEQLKFSFVPTQLTRISPFFVLAKSELKNRKYEKLEWSSGWGSMKIEGEKLSIQDESVLLAVLFLFTQQKTPIVVTKRYELCKILGLTAAKSSYTAIMDSLERLTKTFCKLHIKGECTLFNTILSGGKIEEKTNLIKIHLNEWFLFTWSKGFITGIDLDYRLSIKSDLAKALYRFLVSHKDGQYECHILTMAKAVNMNTTLDISQIRMQVRRALAELRKKGFLKKWAVNKSDIVSTVRADRNLKKC